METLQKNIRFRKRELSFVRALIKGLSDEKRLARKRKSDNYSKHLLRKELRNWHLVHAFLRGIPYSAVEKKKEGFNAGEIAFYVYTCLEMLCHKSEFMHAIPMKQNAYRPRELLIHQVIFDWFYHDTLFFVAPPPPKEKAKSEEVSK